VSILADGLGRLQNRRVSGTSLAASPTDATPAAGPTPGAAEPWPLARLERWFLWAGVFLLPLAYSWDTYDGYALPKLLLARIVIAGLLMLWLARVALTRTLVIRRTPLDLALLAFVVSAAISTVFAYNQNVAVFGTYSRYDGLLTIAGYAALFWLAVQALATPADARALLRVLLASGYVVGAVAILQSMTDSVRLGELAPAFGTMGQKNALGAFLAMLLPLAYWELIAARSWAARVLAANAGAVVGTALFLTFSRSAWLAAGIALLLMMLGAHPGWKGRLIAGGAAVLLLAGAATVVLQAPGVPLQRTDLAQLGDRPVVWSDTLQLIASRPVLGFGPDNFGLVYPAFESIDLHQPWDKAHAETLQVAATQGVVGLAAYAWLIAAFVIAFLRSPHGADSYAVLAAWLAYQLTIQVNFTMLAAAFPFWVLSASALVIFGATREWHGVGRVRRPVAVGAIAGAFIVAAGGVIAVVYPYMADAQLLVAVTADYSGRSDLALAPAQQARMLTPAESVYATEVGNLAFERGDWRLAKEAYEDAARLGTYNPAVFRNLALADRNLGLMDDARIAARRAFALDRFDPANVALLAQLGP
jgi:putative inorganic carbon (HCO3(-)) transporter